MNEILLILIVLATFAGGYFVMGRVDRFLAGSFRNKPPEYQRQRPSCVMLNAGLSDEELIQSIRQFAAQYEHISIIFWDKPPSDAPPPDADGNVA